MEIIENEGIQNFIKTQKELIGIEKTEEQDQLTELLKTTRVKDLVSYGLSIAHLKVTKTRTGMFDKPMITLRKKGYEKLKSKSEALDDPSLVERVTILKEETKISSGDVISLYDFRHDMNFFDGKPILSGTVDYVNKFKIVIMSSDANNADVNVFSEGFKSGSYIIVQMVNDVTYKRYLEALKRLDFYSSRREMDVNNLLRVLFEEDETQDYKDDDKFKVDFFDKRLNADQKKSVRMALGCEHFGLIHGPPGTGKTKTVCEIIKQMCKRKKKLLVTASSNVAVDNVLERVWTDKGISDSIRMVRVGNPSRVLSSSHEFSIHHLVYEAMKSSSEIRNIKREILKHKQQLKKLSRGRFTKEIKIEKKEIYRQIRELERDINNVRIQITNSIFDKADVIFSTQTSCLDKKLENWLVNSSKIAMIKSQKSVSDHKTLKLKERRFFDVAILDEAAQSMMISSFLPIIMAKKCILAGDHKQLPPTVKSKTAEKRGLGATLFSRLADLSDKKYPGLKVLLRTQYRMNSDIMNLSSKYIYNDELIADKSCEKHNLTDFSKTTADDNLLENLRNCIIWVDTSGAGIGDDQEKNDGDKPMPSILATASRFNRGEVEIVKFIYRDLRLDQMLGTDDIGVISPYRAQVELIREALREQEDDNFGEEVVKEEEEEAQAVIPGERKKSRCCEVSTVDGFQGREKEVIVLSLVRSNPKSSIGFLSDERRMNVAITRAKRLLVIVGEAKTTKNQKFIASIYDYIKENGQVISFYDFCGSLEFGGLKATNLRGYRNSGSYKNYVAADKKEKKQDGKEEDGEEGKKKKRKKKKKKKKTKEVTEPEKIGNIKQEQPVQKPVVASPVNYFKEEQEGHIKRFVNDHSQAEMTFVRPLQGFQRDIISGLCDQYDLEIQFLAKNVNKIKKRNFKIIKKEDKTNADKPPEPALLTFEELESIPEGERSESQQKRLKNLKKKREKRRRQKEAKKKKKQEKKEEQEKIDKMTEEEFLDYKAKEMENIKGPVGFCPFVLWDTKKRCLKNVKTLGIKCKFCLVTYCTTHAFPEFHGCDEAADKEARRKNQNAYNKRMGCGFGDREEEMARMALKKKIAESRAGRVQKMKKKGGKKGKKKR